MNRLNTKEFMYKDRITNVQYRTPSSVYTHHFCTKLRVFYWLLLLYCLFSRKHLRVLTQSNMLLQEYKQEKKRFPGI